MSSNTPEYNCALTGGDLYKAANDEYVGRLQARNRIVLAFIAVASTLLGVSASQKGLAFAAVGVGFLSLASSVLSRHHELMMAHLLAFQRALVDEAGTRPKSTWPYFRDEEIVSARQLRDWAQAGIHFTFSAVSLAIAVWREVLFPTPDTPGMPDGAMHDAKVVLITISSIAAMISLLVIALTHTQSSRIARRDSIRR